MTDYIDGGTRNRIPARPRPLRPAAERPVQRAFWISYLALILLAASLIMLWPDAEADSMPASAPSQPGREQGVVRPFASEHRSLVDLSHLDRTGPVPALWKPALHGPCEALTVDFAERDSSSAPTAYRPDPSASLRAIGWNSDQDFVQTSPANALAPGHPRSSTRLGR